MPEYGSTKGIRGGYEVRRFGAAFDHRGTTTRSNRVQALAKLPGTVSVTLVLLAAQQHRMQPATVLHFQCRVNGEKTYFCEVIGGNVLSRVRRGCCPSRHG
jgi:hypothetical protein